MSVIERAQKILAESDDCSLCDDVFCLFADVSGNQIDVAKMSELERIIVLTWHANGIIGNGGFHYLFEGDFRGDPGFAITQAAFQTIGCQQIADAFDEARGQFSAGVLPTNIKERIAQFDQVSEETRKRIDQRVWHSRDQFIASLAKYIRGNKRELLEFFTCAASRAFRLRLFWSRLIRILRPD